MRGLFYRGRHHVRTAPRDAGGLVTVDTIAARIRREIVVGTAHLTIVPDVRPLDPMPAIALAMYGRQMARAKAEGLGALA